VTFASLWCAAKSEEFYNTKTVYVADYGDAVEAIMDSDMFSSDKEKAMEALKVDGDSGYYKAVIHVANSDTFSSSKAKTIMSMNK
jgi:hypothetical protein